MPPIDNRMRTITAVVRKALSGPMSKAALATLLAVLVLLGWVAQSSEAHSASQTADSGLIAKDVQVLSVSDTDSSQAVRLKLAWASATFPGIQECTLEMLNADGVVGTYADTFVDTAPVQTLVVDVPVAAKATSARFACDPQRLDTGSPYEYAVSAVSVAPIVFDSSVPDSEAHPSARVTFDASWSGTGFPGVVDCSLSIVNQVGKAIYTDRFVLQIGDEETTSAAGIGRTLTSEALGTETPSSATIACMPFTGG